MFEDFSGCSTQTVESGCINCSSTFKLFSVVFRTLCHSEYWKKQEQKNEFLHNLADLVVFENKIPLTPMRHENRGKIVFHTFLTVISCSHFAYSQDFKASKQRNLPPVINNVGTYEKSISSDSLKRLVSLQLLIPELVTDFKYATKN